MDTRFLINVCWIISQNELSLSERLKTEKRFEIYLFILLLYLYFNIKFEKVCAFGRKFLKFFRKKRAVSAADCRSTHRNCCLLFSFSPVEQTGGAENQQRPRGRFRNRRVGVRPNLFRCECVIIKRDLVDNAGKRLAISIRANFV